MFVVGHGRASLDAGFPVDCKKLLESANTRESTGRPLISLNLTLRFADRSAALQTLPDLER